MHVLLPPERCKVLLGWQDDDGVTPLMLAAANGRDNCVEYALNLLESSRKSNAVKKETDSQKRFGFVQRSLSQI